jgi:hypothetical protein
LEGAVTPDMQPPTGSAGHRIEIDIRHQDILRAEADALGCVVTPDLRPDDEASRQVFAAASEPLRADIRWALARRGRPRLEPGEGLTLAVRREYPVGRVGFLILAASAAGSAPEERESLVVGAFLREALEWGLESVALPVSEHGVGLTLAAAATALAALPRGDRPPLRRLHLLARDAALLGGLRGGQLGGQLGGGGPASPSPSSPRLG